MRRQIQLLLEATKSSSQTTAGSTAAPSFAEAVETYKGMVYSIAWHYLRQRQIAEEVAQDVFLQLHTNWEAIQSGQHLQYWLRRTAMHRAIDAGRKRLAKAEITLDQADEPSMLERVHDTLLESYLNRMVGSLPENQRSAIILRYQEDMNVEEIAEVLATKVSTVKTNIARGLELLRAKVSGRLRERHSDL